MIKSNFIETETKPVLNLDERRKFVKEQLFEGRLTSFQDDERSSLFLGPRHNFRVSETNIAFNERHLADLDEVSSLMEGFVGGTHRLIEMATVLDQETRRDPLFHGLRAVMGLEAGFQEAIRLKKLESGGLPLKNSDFEEVARISGLKDENPPIHEIFRVDLVCERGGNFKIAEVEVGKAHGFGYTTMCRSFSNLKVGSGLVQHFADSVTDGQLDSISAHFNERFYFPEMGFFCRSVNSLIESAGVNRSLRLVVGDRPTLSVHPIMQSKIPLALISNGMKNPALESLLQVCFDADLLRKLRKFIPESFLPLNRDERLELASIIREGERDPDNPTFFMKLARSSGSRGIIIDPEAQVKELASKSLLIVQRGIVTERGDFDFCDVLTGERGVMRDCSARLGLFSSRGKSLDLGVTLTEGPVSHGGVRSIQTGVSPKGV